MNTHDAAGRGGFAMSTALSPAISALPTPEQPMLALPTTPMPARPARNRILRAAPRLRRDRWRGAALVAIKAAHSLIFFTEEASVGYLLYAGLTKRQGRTTVLPAGAVAAASAIYFAHGPPSP